MNDKKNIDRLFQEKFKDFEAAPNDAVWNRINESLPKKKKKRRVIALWWQVGGVAAAIALLLTVGVSVFNSDVNTTEDPVIVDTKDVDNNKANDDSNVSPKEKQNELNDDAELQKLELVDSEKNNPSIENKKRDDNTSEEKKASSKLTSPNKLKSDAVVNNKSNKKEKTSLNQKRKNLIINKDNNTKIAENTKNSENSNTTKLTNSSEIKSAIKKTIKDNKTAITNNTTSKESETSNFENTDVKINTDLEKETGLLEDPKKQSIENAIAAQENNIEKEKEDEQNRWSIKPNVAPVYFSSLGQGSSIDGQFNGNSKSSDINMSYGITGTYAVSKKLKIRAGVNRLNLNQTTSDVFTFTSGEFAARGALNQMTNINTKDGLHNVALMSANMFNRNSTPEIFNTKITGDIDQRFGFIEVPLELEYRLLDKKFGLNVIGGFSTFFLSENEVYADINGSSTLIGEANNINSTSFSANFGLGLDYKLSKQWNINLEPQFKYQINTFNNTSGDFRPFFIGVYTGLSFKF